MNRCARDLPAGNGGPSAGAGFGAALEDERRAAFVVDAQAAQLIAANEAGRALFALPEPVAFPVALDSAMPAVRRLRQIEAGSKAAAQEQLTVWRKGQLVRIAAEVSKEPMGEGRARLVVRALNAPVPQDARDGSADAAAPVPAAGTPEARAGTAPGAEALPPDDADTPAPPVPRDDRETLREIARRIREGHRPITIVAGQDSAEAGPAGPRAPASQPSPGGEGSTPGAPLPPRQATVAPDARALSKIAHELKTPLSAIVAASEIMRDERLGSMGNALYLGYARDIHESARHALDVINAMLTGTPREVRTMAPVDLTELALSTVSVMLPLADASRIHLEADCGDERLEVTGDATAIRQIIYNLIANALKFTPSGGEVHVVTGYLPNGTPFFVVRDTGEGMNEDDIVRAFYSGEDRIGVRPGGGYGIGLPLVRQLAEDMGATIDVDSAPGKGTVVLVSFPRR